MQENDLLGRIVYSKSGRDRDNYFVIVGILNDEYVYIADGDIRKLESPKKKKKKHLIFTDKYLEDIKGMTYSSKMISNSKLRKILKAEVANEEV